MEERLLIAEETINAIPDPEPTYGNKIYLKTANDFILLKPYFKTSEGFLEIKDFEIKGGQI